MLRTVPSILEYQASSQSEAPAILGLDQPSCSYGQLYELVQHTVSSLNSVGLSRNDPVAVVLQNGPMMAAVFLAVASGFACAPLNPAFTAAEFEFYLADLHVKALLIDYGSTSPASEVAKRLGIPVIHACSSPNEAAGSFTLDIEDSASETRLPVFARPNDVALILHTSGTTQKPKMVPLTHKNICSSARNIVETLLLSPADLCLNIMPLFHIHGLIAVVLSSMLAGGRIACTPGFFVNQFFSWLESFKPTWYTAVPSMHQSIIDRARSSALTIRKDSLRFIRSSSASLAPNVLSELESLFGVPVIEAYGMTEASHQMASNPLPPRMHKAGSVGPAAGPEVAIMSEDQPVLMPQGVIGEIVIRGDNVTLGYLHNPEANTKSFTNGWFRTGDQGYLDENGYLFITGRLKEIINKGGEKISPREVDEVLLSHPAVLQAVAFAIPDRVLGEDIAAAVVLKDPAIGETDLKFYAASKLVFNKVPARILILDEIPKGPTGKVQRVGLAKKLGLDSEISTAVNVREPPRTETEKKVCAIWHKVLGTQEIGIDDRFRSVGGDSMLAVLVHLDVEAEFGRSIPLEVFYQATTIKEQAQLIEGIQPGV